MGAVIDATHASLYNRTAPEGCLLSDEVVAFLSSGVSLLVGTRDAHHRPACGRAVGLRIEPDRAHVTVFLSDATSERMIRDLHDNGHMALVASEIISHRTLQLKGVAEHVAPAVASERALLDDYVARFGEVLEMVGLPLHITRRVNTWPATAVRLRVRELFEQTPGPGAGAPFKGRWT